MVAGDETVQQIKPIKGEGITCFYMKLGSTLQEQERGETEVNFYSRKVTVPLNEKRTENKLS